jgi:hypothetical protein
MAQRPVASTAVNLTLAIDFDVVAYRTQEELAIPSEYQFTPPDINVFSHLPQSTAQPGELALAEGRLTWLTTGSLRT